MGLAVFQIEGGGGLGLTYVTGALVKAGQLIAAALTGSARLGFLPNLLMRAALVAGSLLGAFGHSLDQSCFDLVRRGLRTRTQRHRGLTVHR
jgi:uncharacterized membrane protein YoaK (UPF0700 family)